MASASSAEVEILSLAAGVLPDASSDQTYHSYRKLVARTIEVFGDEIKASRWLSLPNPDLNGATPIQAVQESGYSTSLLEPIFTRIEHGIDY
jgi:uncharacterized protein (DUF2384 family)